MPPKQQVNAPYSKFRAAAKAVTFQNKLIKQTSTTTKPIADAWKRNRFTRSSSVNLLDNLKLAAEQQGPVARAVSIKNKKSLQGVAVILDLDNTCTQSSAAPDEAKSFLYNGHTGGYTVEEYDLMCSHNLIGSMITTTFPYIAATDLAKNPARVLKNDVLEYIHMLIDEGATIMFATEGNIKNVAYVNEAYKQKYGVGIPQFESNVFGRATQLDGTTTATAIESYKQIKEETGRIHNSGKKILYDKIIAYGQSLGIAPNQMIVIDDNTNNLKVASECGMTIPGITSLSSQLEPWNIAAFVSRNDIFVNREKNLLSCPSLNTAMKYQARDEADNRMKLAQ